MTRRWSPVILRRECTARTVPAGETVVLSEGGEVEVVQHLGRSITVRTQLGSLLRIDDDDADAIGLVPPVDGDVEAAVDEGGLTAERVLDALRGVYDPEIPVDVVELGLVYRCDVLAEDDGTRRVEIDMSMTAPGCGMGDVLADDAERIVAALAGVDAVEVRLVFEPPWTVERMSDAARLRLGML